MQVPLIHSRSLTARVKGEGKEEEAGRVRRHAIAMIKVVCTCSEVRSQDEQGYIAHLIPWTLFSCTGSGTLMVAVTRDLQLPVLSHT